jgi:hypothetical protein
MKTLDPIGLFRYLNPRASGLIVFKGGGGGASAEQVDESVAAGTAAVNENTNARAAEAAVVGEEIKTNQGTMLSNQNDLKSGQSDIRRDIANIPQTTVVSQTVDTSGIENRIGSLEGTTDRGFADVGGRLDTVNNTLGDVQGSVDTGFASMNQNFNDITEGHTGIQNTLTDVAGNMTERFDTVDNTLDTGFTGVNENINTQFDTQNQNLTDMSANILGGQTSLQEYLEGMSGRADTYYGGLAEGQANLQNNLSGLQSGFTDFRDAYDTNTTLANQTRAELMDTVSGGFNNVRGAIADNFQDTRSDINQVSAQVDNVQNRQANLNQTQTQDFTNTLRDLASGLEATTRDQAASQSDVLNRLDTVKQVLAAQGENIPEDIRAQYTALAMSFDQNGRLIRESVDDQGVITRRAMDDQSNVLMAQFNQQGNMLGQSMINVNSLLRQMDNFGYTGTGAQPGSLAPQQLANRRAAIESGMMERQDPYFNTFG